MSHTHEHEHHDHDCCDECCEKMHLVLDDDTELSCDVVGIFSVSEDSDKEYIALIPDDSDDLLFYRYAETDDGEVSLDNIDSEEEFDLVSQTFDELFLDDEDSEDGEELSEI